MPGKTPATVNEFVNMRRTFAENQVSNMTPGMERLQNKQMEQDFAKQLQAQYAAKGIPSVIHPVTFKVTPIYDPMTSQVGTPAAGTPTQTSGPQMTPAPGFAPINPLAGTTPVVNLPGATGPTFADGYPETVGMRYPAPVAPAAPSQPFFRPWVYDLNDRAAQNRAASNSVLYDWLRTQAPPQTGAPGTLPAAQALPSNWLTK